MKVVEISDILTGDFSDGGRDDDTAVFLTDPRDGDCVIVMCDDIPQLIFELNAHYYRTKMG
jgi:hypothetical protein